MIIPKLLPIRRQPARTVLMALGAAIAATLIILSVAAPTAQAQVAQAEPEYTGDDRIEKWKGKTVLAVTPHPDDETFTSGGLLAMAILWT